MLREWFMAIYHLHVSVVQRSKGDNIIAKSAYRRAARLYDEKEAKHWNYTNKPDVIYSEITVPENAPDWVKALVELHAEHPALAAGQLWNQLDKAEKRVDAQLAREIEFALPIELNEAQSIELARAFIHDQCAMLGMIADWSIHWDKGNPHVHVLLTMRSLTETGFGQRVRAWDSKTLLQTWREKWAEYANFHLHCHQHAVRIDHRSYAEQGIDLVPGLHEGKAAKEMAKRGIGITRLEEAAEIRALNLAKLSENAEIIFRYLGSAKDTFTHHDISQVLHRYLNHKSPAAVTSLNQRSVNHSATKTELLDAALKNTALLTPDIIEKILALMAEHHSVFTEKMLTQAVSEFIKDADQFAKAVMEITRHQSVIALGLGEDGREHFTTRAFLEMEESIQNIADELRERIHLPISKRALKNTLAQHQQQTGCTLTEEQKNAVSHLLNPATISCVVGRAGTGKSFCLGAAKLAWEAQGLNVYGIALAGIAADGLNKSVGMQSSTIKSFTYRIEKGSLVLQPGDVVVMDEAGMTDSISMLAILKIVQEAKAKLVLVGDPAQLQPVGPGATFRALLERLGFAEIQMVYRQSEPWQRQATVDFSAGKMAEGLRAYQAAGCIHLTEKSDDAINLLCADWKKLSATHDLSHILVVAHRNEDVDAFNGLLRAERVKAGVLSEGYAVTTAKGEIRIAQGERILFLENDSNLGIFKGRFATVQWVDFRESGRVIQLTAKLDGSDNVVTIDPLQYAHFTYGYAATVHKTQGATMDHNLVYAGGKGWNRQLTYVALSRHRKNCHLYADKETHTDEATLARHLSRLGRKDSVLDFLAAFAWRRGIEANVLQDKPKLSLLEKIVQQFGAEKSKPQPHYTPEQVAIIQQTIKRRADAKVVADYVDARQAAGMNWQALQAKLSKWGLSKLPYQDKASLRLLQDTAEYQAFKTAQRNRNQKADEILTAPERYTQALAIHDIDRSKLTVHAESHLCYQRIQRYLTQLKSGFEVYRDHAALHIVCDIKRHYPHLQETEINQSVLKKHALAYRRRQGFLTLTPQEKAGFEWVEAYQAANQAVGSYWSEHLKGAKQPTPAVAEELERLKQVRGELAARIISHSTDCEKALDFYQFGKTVSHFGEPISAQQSQYAQARWYKLQQQGAWHTLQARVLDYQQACEHNLAQRLSLAYEILQDTKAHHGAIIKAVGNEAIPGVWRQIRQDAKRFEAWQCYRKLDAVDRLGFKNVQRYVEAKATCKRLWRDFFKRYQQQANLSVPQKLATDPAFARLIAEETLIRDALTAKLLENLTLHQAGLTFYQIQPEELDKTVYAYQCRLRVDDYVMATSRLERAGIAVAILADPKAHTPFIKKSHLTWSTLRYDAAIAERRKQFAGLHPVEKALHRLVDRYHTANRAVGKGFARYRQQKTTQAKFYPLPPKLKLALAKRDYFAWRLVNECYFDDLEQLNRLVLAHKLDSTKLLQQQARFTEQLTTIERYQQYYQQAIIALQNVYQSKKQSSQDKQAHDIQTAIDKLHQAIAWQARHAFYSSPEWRYALASYELSNKQTEKQHQWLTSLKTTLQSYAASQKIILSSEIKPALISAPLVTTAYTKIDSQRVRAALNERVEQVATHYLGEPKSQQGHVWRYGSNQGSLVVTVSGAKQGLWHDFQLGKGGDMLTLIQHVLGKGNFKSTLQEALQFLGGESVYQTMMPLTAKQTLPLAKTHINEDAHTQKRIQKAQQIVRGTQSIIGTLAERYLREHRGITGTILEDTFRYHPKLKNWMAGSVHPALVIVARDKAEKVCGIQAIFLDEKTAKKATELKHQVKLSRGLIGEGALVQQGKSDATIALAEGPETALSIAVAQPDWTVYVTFGVSNFAKVRLPENTKSILICADNDGQDSTTQKSIEKSAEKLAQRGMDVWVAEPQKPEQQAKWDFNDVLLANGIIQVQQDLAKATLYQKGITKENLNEAIEKTLFALNESPVTQAITPNEQANSAIAIQNQSVKEILAQYVDMELEQTRFVNAMHSAKLKDPKAVKAAVTETIAHANKIQGFAEQAIEHPEIKTILETKQNIKPPHIADRGGFIGIRERLQRGEWAGEDIHVLMAKLRNKAEKESWAQVRNKSQRNVKR